MKAAEMSHTPDMVKAKILLVDDEEEILKTLSASLDDEGYDVWTSRDGTEAIELVRTQHPDIIFLDIWIPGMDGIETLKAIKEFDADIEVVIMTGHGTVNTSVQAIKLGAFDFLEKPLSLDTVLDIIRKIMEQNILPREGQEVRFRTSRKEELIGSSEAVRKLRREITRLAKEEGPILILGEHGTGKELVARLIYSQPYPKRRPMLKFSCSIWPQEELEEGIFGPSPNGQGKRKTERKAVLEQAIGRGLYLDSIEELLPISVQQRLAHYLKERKQNRSIAAVLPRGPTRIIASSTRDLQKATREGTFSKELLECFPKHVLRIQPLRDRKSDIPDLTNFFLKNLCMEYGRKPKEIDDEAMQTLVACDWPGNVKELKNIVERMVIAVPISLITYNDIPPSIRGSVPQDEGGKVQTYEMWDSYQDAVDSLEKDYLSYHLRKNNNDVRTTAKSLQMDPRRLSRRVDKLGLIPGAEKQAYRFRQRTLKRSVVLAGQGLHSGVKTGLILTPLPPNSGVLFGNISTGDTVPAHIDFVESTEFATFLRKGAASAKTTEHFLAVLNCYRISNLLVKINDELPIMDGSATDFCSMVEDAGIEEQEAPLEEVIIDKKYVIGEETRNTKFIRIEPADCFQVHYTLDYPEPIGRQEVLFVLKDQNEFKERIAPARTFGYVKDVEKLESMGLASGGRLNNVILLDDERVVNTTLRFPDEFARHKILDILGDFYLLGRPIRGKITAQMTGHSENVALLKLIREQMKIV